MKNKRSEYSIEKVFEIEDLVNVRFLDLSCEDVEVGEALGFWQFLYVDSGEVSVGMDGAEVSLGRGDICFFEPGTRYSIQGNTPDHARVFDVAFVCQSEHMCVFRGKRGTLPAALAPQLPPLMQNAYQGFEFPAQGLLGTSVTKRLGGMFGTEQCFVNRLELLLIELARKEIYPHVVPPVSKALLKDELVVRVITILEENVYHKLTMAQIVEDMNYSETYISRRFKSVCGQSIMSYYLQLRIFEAQRLIRETNMTFTEISGMLGFSDSQHFTKTFKRYLNLSPKAYLKSVRPYSMRRTKKNTADQVER